MLEVKDLEVYYGAIHAVKGISLRVEDGQIVTLIGSNGAGKSTTLHTISGLIKPRSGNILLMGRILRGRRPIRLSPPVSSRCRKGATSLPICPLWKTSIWGRISARTRTALKKIRRRSLSSSPPFERKNQLSGTLSGGEQQMLAMGRALMERPRVLLLDEPSMGLARFLSRKSFPSSRPSTRKARRSSSWNKMPIWPCPLLTTPTSLKRDASPQWAGG